MKLRPPFAAVLLVAAPAFLPALFAADEKPAPAVKAVFVDPDSPEVADIRKAGEGALNYLAMRLVNELNSAIARGGLEAALDVAHLKNLPMTGDRPRDLPRVKAMKRTSFRLRSPANAPDAADQVVLDRVIKDLASDFGAPKILVQRIDTPNAPPEWRVYSPLGSLPMCLKCHGDPDMLPVALREKLNAQYPTDQASGYRIGEWRGLLRVTVDPTAPPPPAPTKAAPAKSAPAKSSATPSATKSAPKK